MRALAVVLALTIALATAAAPEGASSVALLRGGRTWVPIRTVGELLGATVSYSGGRVQLSLDDRQVQLTVGSAWAAVNGQRRSLDAPPFVMAGGCYVPLRFVAEELGAQVECAFPCRQVTVTRGSAQASLTVVIDRGATLTYQGAWFDISYPRGFVVRECEPSPSSSGYDGVGFLAPDGTVEFYVYSPQWSGTSQWANLRPGEAVVSREQGREGDTVVTRAHVAEGDAAGQRAWVEVVNPTLNTSHLFGIWFLHQTDYDRWKPAYLAFKRSLVQYAD